MMIISEGTPMTNGEVLALLRRRRDERNAKMQPSFGLQFVGSSTTPQLQQQQRTSVSSAASASVQTKLFFPPDVLVGDLDCFNTIGAGISGSSRLLGHNNKALFISPTASHIIVLLTEVRTLRYLSRYATISGIGGVRTLYGPTSVQGYRHHKSRDIPTIGEEEGDCSHIDANGYYTQERLANDEISTRTNEEAMSQMVLRYRPGSVGCVRAVDALLEMWENKGRETERRDAAKVKAVLRALTLRLREATGNNGVSPSLYCEEANEKKEQQQQEQRSFSMDQPRLLFAPPSTPLALFLAEQSPVANGVVSGVSTVLLQGRHQWTEQDIIRLVMARPRDSLDVHRVVDGVDELVGQNEELLAFVEEELVKVFL